MLRLNNKDYTVEQLERLIYLVSVIAKDTALNEVEIKEVKDLKEVWKDLQCMIQRELEKK